MCRWDLLAASRRPLWRALHLNPREPPRLPNWPRVPGRNREGRKAGRRQARGGGRRICLRQRRQRRHRCKLGRYSRVQEHSFLIFSGVLTPENRVLEKPGGALALDSCHGHSAPACRGAVGTLVWRRFPVCSPVVMHPGSVSIKTPGTKLDRAAHLARFQSREFNEDVGGRLPGGDRMHACSLRSIPEPVLERSQRGPRDRSGR